MYCPNCAAKAADQTKYCRACGQSLTLISQAMMKSAPVDDDDRQKLEKAIKNICLGVGFLIISIVAGVLFVEPVNWMLCFSMLIAGMVPLSIGVAEILGRAISGSRRKSSVDQLTVKETAPILRELPSGGDAGHPVELMAPSGVTEVTTKNLEVVVEQSRDN